MWGSRHIAGTDSGSRGQIRAFAASLARGPDEEGVTSATARTACAAENHRTSHGFQRLKRGGRSGSCSRRDLNYRELRRDLENQAMFSARQRHGKIVHLTRTRSAMRGAARGMFAFAVGLRASASPARGDRLGIKQLYYCNATENCLLVGAEPFSDSERERRSTGVGRHRSRRWRPFDRSIGKGPKLERAHRGSSQGRSIA